MSTVIRFYDKLIEYLELNPDLRDQLKSPLRNTHVKAVDQDMSFTANGKAPTPTLRTVGEYWGFGYAEVDQAHAQASTTRADANER
jgi:hypothetical protein